MKTIKSVNYRNHIIDVRARFKEISEAPEQIGSITSSWSTAKAITIDKDAVEFELVIIKDYGGKTVLGDKAVHVEKTTIKSIKNNRKELYEKFNKEVESLIAKGKKIVDQKDREWIMTRGLPDSLLKNEKIEETDKQETDTVTNIINVFIEAVEKVDTKEIDSFIKILNDKLKNSRGMR